jgi:hypothetical protein
MTLGEVAGEIGARLARLFLPDASGRRPFAGGADALLANPGGSDHLLFHEYFHADEGRGCGASHQTGWTSLIIRCLEDLARRHGATK